MAKETPPEEFEGKVLDVLRSAATAIEDQRIRRRAMRGMANVLCDVIEANANKPDRFNPPGPKRIKTPEPAAESGARDTEAPPAP